MSETSASLLDRLRHQPDESSWKLLTDLYTPLIWGWLRRHARVNADDADDLVQDVLTVVVRRLAEFERQRSGAFRAWLRQITVNCLRDFWKARRRRPLHTGGSDFQVILDQLADPTSDLSRLWDQEYEQHLMRQALELVKPHFETKTWTAFQRVIFDAVEADAVAEELSMSVGAVYTARSRVMARLRREIDGLIE